MTTTTHVDEFKSAGQSPGPSPLAKGTKLPVCLMGGRHTPDSEWERECPLNPERIAKRSARAAAIWASRRKKQGVLDAVEKPTGQDKR